MDRCDEVFQRVYETMFEQTDDPLPDVVPVTRELRCQMLQQHLRHSSQRLMQRCGVDRSDADLQRIGSCFQQLRRMECAILFRCALADSAQGAGGAGHYGRGRRKMR